MSDIYSRLRDIVRAGSRSPARELTYEPDPGYEAGHDPARVAEILGGRSIETAAGPCLVIDRRYEADRWHGCVRVGDCELADETPLRLLDGLLQPAGARSPGGFPPIFIDLETTGLSGGAGTVAFLVGCAWFDLGAFQVRQFLLTSFATEQALLAAVADLVRPADLVVTFNGKTFDLPVMETRWLFHRLETPFADKRHFDMLHPARRLWRSRDEKPVPHVLLSGETMADCSLGALERDLFGVERIGDVPGFEIPSRYFRFLRGGDPGSLETVLEHNRIDLISLAAVTARACRLVVDGVEACRDAAECLALGRVLERAGDGPRAEACFRRAVERGGPQVRVTAWRRLARLFRRERRYAEAAACWREILAVRSRALEVVVARREALEALAVHHEHRAKDLDGARTFAHQALEQAEAARRAASLRHRLDRLERKLVQVQTKGRPEGRPLLAEHQAGGDDQA